MRSVSGFTFGSPTTVPAASSAVSQSQSQSQQPPLQSRLSKQLQQQQQQQSRSTSNNISAFASRQHSPHQYGQTLTQSSTSQRMRAHEPHAQCTQTAPQSIDSSMQLTQSMNQRSQPPLQSSLDSSIAQTDSETDLDSDFDDESTMIRLNPSSSMALPAPFNPLTIDKLTQDKLSLYISQLQHSQLTDVRSTFVATIDLCRLLIGKRSHKSMQQPQDMLDYLRYLHQAAHDARPFDPAIDCAFRQVLALVRSELNTAAINLTKFTSSEHFVQSSSPRALSTHHKATHSSSSTQSHVRSITPSIDRLPSSIQTDSHSLDRTSFHKVKPLIMEALHDLHTQVESTSDDLAQQVLEHMLPDSVVLVHGYSADVLQCIIESHHLIKSLYVVTGALRNGAEDDRDDAARQSMHFRPAVTQSDAKPSSVKFSQSTKGGTGAGGGGGGGKSKKKQQQLQSQSHHAPQSSTHTTSSASMASSSSILARHANGATLARELSRRLPSLHITVIPDAAVYAVMPLIDVCLLDSLSVHSSGDCRSSHGALSISLSAHMHRSKVIMLAPFYKFMPDSNALTHSYSSSSSSSQYMTHAHPLAVLQPELISVKVSGYAPLTDQVPARLITMLAGDVPSRPSQIKRQINEYYNAKDC